MEYKAVIFDLFETLITEWGHPKYTKKKICSDLGIEKEAFERYWDEKEKDRYIGKLSFADSIRYVCEKCGKQIDESTLSYITEKRITTKSACFEHIHPDVLQLLSNLRTMGLRLAIISNCSSEEVTAIKQSRIYTYFDQVVLSYEIEMQKPDSRIYQTAVKLLGVTSNECVFVGDGGSRELEGAKSVGMRAIQAKWYTNQHPYKRDSIEGFLTAEQPLDVLQYISG